KWHRIYTTNYDDIVENVRRDLGRNTSSYSRTDDLPWNFESDSIVHLHGSVTKISEENLMAELVLGEAAYVNEYLTRSPWYTQFQADIRYCSNLFIVGYSLSDFHISALLLGTPGLAEKTFFIQGPKIDERFKRKTEAYGKTLNIGVDGFAKQLTSNP